MAAADVSALIEVASSPDPSTPVTPTETTVEETPLETTESPETGAQGTPESAETPTEGTQPRVDARTNPDAIRKALKSWRDSMPEGDAQRQIPRQLNDIVGREKAFRDVFPKVADAKQAKFILDSVGGGEGLTKLQETIRSVNETDALFYAGDGKVVKNLYDDMKAAGKAESFGKLASPFLEQLQEVDPKAYGQALRPHFYNSMVASGLPGMLDHFDEALGEVGADGKPAPNVELVKKLVAEIKRWFGTEKQAVEGAKRSAIDPERQAFDRERSEFRTSQQKAFQGEVHTEWNRVNADALGGALKPYLKLPFAKNWTDATKASVAREITQTLIAELKDDKTYQSQMDAFWSEAKPDKQKIINYHKGKLDLVAKRIVKDVLDARYPGFSSVKGAPSPAPRPGTPQTPAPAGPAKPIYQTTQPKPDAVDWDRTSDVLYTTGRFYDKKGVLRTWSQKYK